MYSSITRRANYEIMRWVKLTDIQRMKVRYRSNLRGILNRNLSQMKKLSTIRYIEVFGQMIMVEDITQWMKDMQINGYYPYKTTASEIDNPPLDDYTAELDFNTNIFDKLIKLKYYKQTTSHRVRNMTNLCMRCGVLL